MKMRSLKFFTACLWMMLPQITSAQSILDSVSATQCILVITDNDAAAGGQLFFFEKENNAWSSVLEKVPVTIGKNGAAWGKGLHPGAWNTGTLKKEGDGKSPKGIFDVGAVFGYAASGTEVKRVYLPSDSSCYCVDDSRSKHYNKIVDTRYIRKEWTSAEKMLRSDNLYKWGIEIGYNQEPVRPGDGSCIFMHIWRGAGKPTAGCTAMPEAQLLRIIGELEYNKICTFILLTRSEFAQYKSIIGLNISLP